MDMKKFLKVCKMHKQSELKKYLRSYMSSNGYEVVNKDGFLFCKPKENGVPVCLTAHMDTVHPLPIKQIVVERHEGRTIISSPQGIGGDDRCGIYMIMECVKDGYRPYVVFCEDEEIGCVGAEKFVRSKDIAKLQDCKFIVQLDRRNATDAVYYDCDNAEFEEWVTEVSGYKTAIGSCSDISVIAPEVGIAAVNLSCGYYQEHKPEHYVVWEEMENTLAVTKKLIAESANVEQFEYVERVSYYGRYGYGWDDYDYYWQRQSVSGKTETYDVQWYDEDSGNMKHDYISAVSQEEAIGKFLILHDTLSYGYIWEIQTVHYSERSEKNGKQAVSCV